MYTFCIFLLLKYFCRREIGQKYFAMLFLNASMHALLPRLVRSPQLVCHTE